MQELPQAKLGYLNSEICFISSHCYIFINDWQLPRSFIFSTCLAVKLWVNPDIYSNINLNIRIIIILRVETYIQ